MSNTTPDHDHKCLPKTDRDHHQDHHDDHVPLDHELEASKPKLEQLSVLSTDREEQKLEYYDDCKTPTSEDQKIPTTQSCPPTPRKPASDRVFLRKRKFSEFHFFESTGREEVESFFRSTFKFSGLKKRCKSV
ncbi:hypothetical protein L484_011762 [Morus notabilis]|uniref:Cyclin-dependent protein kinase inhibitor SMR2 n=1 Tax=Morus notabilis TaxID=981085 RepID=W9S3U9_9ROSA|nr:cyclin-dependent protein kinase inhibitor SMR2 [Morus notabilis]EXC24896.1 hypothetical protein L484_011762 [Morus notabilis]